MADTALDKLIGSSQGVLDKLGALGGSAEKATKAWAGLLGPHAASGAPPEPATPAPSPKSFAPGGVQLSLTSIVAGVAAFALLAYLVIRGK